MPLIVEADLTARIGAAEVARFSRNTAANITGAIEQAESSVRSAALNIFTAESWAAMTAATLPPEAKRHIVSDAVDILSAGSGRDEEITVKAEEARRWRSWLAGNKVRCFDGILVVQSAGVSYSTRAPRVFDRTDPNSAFNLRDKPI